MAHEASRRFPPRPRLQRVRPANPEDPAWRTAQALHSAMIHLLRRLRARDEALRIGPAQLSALSVLVFGGRRTLGALAREEGVRPPTMTRIVRGLERSRLVEREPHPSDRRATVLRATRHGRRLMLIGREHRLRQLTAGIEGLSVSDRELLDRAAALLERIAR